MLAFIITMNTWYRPDLLNLDQHPEISAQGKQNRKATWRWGKKEISRMLQLRAFPMQHLRFMLPLLILAISACRGGKMNELRAYYSRLESIPPAKWGVLSHKKIYFGHQSVGQNIIDGIKDVMGRNSSIRLNIRETSNPGDFANPVFAHSPIGQNMDPKSKIDDFRKILENGVAQAADIAIFKFCFVDIDRKTDISSLFDYYDETITDLGNKYPNLRIITFTVPLTNTPKGIKPMIKRILGMMPPHRNDNKKRNMFNEILRNKYEESVFDLAELEATSPDGKKTFFKDGNETYDLLNPTYTDDGGHLNAQGKQVMAIDLLRFLLGSEKD